MIFNCIIQVHCLYLFPDEADKLEVLNSPDFDDFSIELSLPGSTSMNKNNAKWRKLTEYKLITIDSTSTSGSFISEVMEVLYIVFRYIIILCHLPMECWLHCVFFYSAPGPAGSYSPPDVAHSSV